MSFRGKTMLMSIVMAAGCADLSFVEVEAEEPFEPYPPSAHISLTFYPTDGTGRLAYISASFREWGPTSPDVTLHGGMSVPPVFQPSDGIHYHGISDTLAADAPAEIRSVAFTWPHGVDATPIVVGLPTLRRIGGTTVCADSSGLVALGFSVDGAPDSTAISWFVSVASNRPSEQVTHRAFWMGSGQPLATLPMVALPEGDTLSATFRVSIWQSLTIDDSVRVNTSTDLEEHYEIVSDSAGACSASASELPAFISGASTARRALP